MWRDSKWSYPRSKKIRGLLTNPAGARRGGFGWGLRWELRRSWTCALRVVGLGVR